MSDHLRLQIRDRLVTIMGTISPAPLVVKSFAYDFDRLTLPAIAVNVGDEASGIAEFMGMNAPRVMERQSDFDVAICIEDNDDADGAMIGMAQKVEVAIATATSNPWKTMTLIESAAQLDGGAQKVRGKLTLKYRATYFARENAPDVAL